MPADNNLIVKASGALTTTTTGAVIDLGSRTVQPLELRLIVTSITGTQGTMDVQIQECDTSNGTFVDMGNFPQVTTSTGAWYKKKSPRRYIKYVATLAGTSPNFTCQIDVVAAGRDIQF
jgi:hypothetical protein